MEARQEARRAALADLLGGDVLNEDLLPEEDEEPDPDMFMSQDEVGWAQELKMQVEADTGIEPLTDLEYAEYALFNVGDMEHAMKQIKGMQQLRTMYNIQDTLEECVHCMQEFIRLLPGFFLHLDVCAESGTPIWVVGMGAFNPAILMVSEQNWKTYVLWEHYTCKAMMPSLRSCREGVHAMMDACEMGWHAIDTDFNHRFFVEIVPCLPLKHKHTQIYNCNSAVNIFFSLIKRTLPQKWKAVLQFGCRVDELGGGDTLSLSEIYLQPSYDVAMERLVWRVRRLWALRYMNNEKFRL